MKRPAADLNDRKGKRRRTSPAVPTRNLQLLDLSEETLLQALSELDYADLLTASETSSHLYRLANDEQVRARSSHLRPGPVLICRAAVEASL